MTAPIPASTFELRGEYCGFIRTLLGKKRMVLRTGRDEAFLKVPKDLRRQLQASLAEGADITVCGYEVCGGEKQGAKRVVSDVRLTGSEKSLACAQCSIRICVKKNCWRQGGRELWQAVEDVLARRGVEETVKLKSVDCLDHCKRAPNAESGGHDFHHCRPPDAERIVAAALRENEISDRSGRA